MGTPIVIAKNIKDTSKEIVLLPQFANRHGLIAGATGTGRVAGMLRSCGLPVWPPAGARP